MIQSIFKITLDPLMQPEMIKNKETPNQGEGYQLIYSDY